MLEQVDHVALVVENLAGAIRLYQDAFEVSDVRREPDTGQGFDVATFEVGESKIELLSPTREGSVIARWLTKNGPGMHHIAYRVRDVVEAAQHCAQFGLQVVDPAPRPGSGGTRILFLHPKSTCGTLIELVEVPEDSSLHQG